MNTYTDRKERMTLNNEPVSMPRRAKSLNIQPERLIQTKRAAGQMFDVVVSRLCREFARQHVYPWQTLLVDYRSGAVSLSQMAGDAPINTVKQLRVGHEPEERKDMCVREDEEGEWGVVRYMRAVYPQNVVVNSVDGDFFPMFAYYIERIRAEFPNDNDAQQIYWIRDNKHPVLHVNALFHPKRMIGGQVWTAPMVTMLSLEKNDYTLKDEVLPGVGPQFVLSAVHLAGHRLCNIICSSKPVALKDTDKLVCEEKEHQICKPLSCFLILAFLSKHANYRLPGDFDLEQKVAEREMKENSKKRLATAGPMTSKARKTNTKAKKLKKAPKMKTRVMDSINNTLWAFKRKTTDDELLAYIQLVGFDCLMQLAKKTLTPDRYRVLSSVVDVSQETMNTLAWMVSVWNPKDKDAAGRLADEVTKNEALSTADSAKDRSVEDLAREIVLNHALANMNMELQATDKSK